MTRQVKVALLFCGMAVAAPIQDASHDHADVIVNGATNPELIPDNTANRLVFIAVGGSSGDSPQEAAARRSHLIKIGLPENDSRALAGIMASFKSQYGDLVKAYNDEADAAVKTGNTPDFAAFVLRRDALVEKTKAVIANTLPAASFAAFNAHVQREKRQMQLHGPTTSTTAVN